MKSPWERHGTGERFGERAEALRSAEAGFGLAEVMAATVILMIVVISLTNLLVDSLNAALVSRQRDQAASLASDVIENAKALGQASLSLAPTGAGSCLPPGTQPVPVLTQLTFQQCFKSTVDNTTYTLSPAVTVSTTGPDNVTVSVTWATPQQTYVTNSQVGT